MTMKIVENFYIHRKTDKRVSAKTQSGNVANFWVEQKPKQTNIEMPVFFIAWSNSKNFLTINWNLKFESHFEKN